MATLGNKFLRKVRNLPVASSILLGQQPNLEDKQQPSSLGPCAG